MIKGSEIAGVYASEILDSRGNPTVMATVKLESGAVGSASVPSGASVGVHEAHELRDGGKRYGGKGVLMAKESVNGVIRDSIVGISALDTARVDSVMIAMDATENKSRLGANSTLAVSLATARAAANHLGIPLFRFLGGAANSGIPMPMMNILNGGAHAGNNVDIQEFMIVPRGADSFAEGVRFCSEIYSSLKKTLCAKGLSTSVGDEGGFAPNLNSEREAVELILEAVERAGYTPGEDVCMALDVASSEWYSEKDGIYHLPKAGKRLSREQMCEFIFELVKDFPIISVEDGMAEDDISGWKLLTGRLGKNTILVGDDLFVTNKSRLEMGIREHIANAILIKPNQIGTVSEVFDAVQLAKSKGYKTIMSHRSGDTADTFIADLAVALGSDMIKSGAPARAERVEKYNRLINIEDELFSPFLRFV